MLASAKACCIKSSHPTSITCTFLVLQRISPVMNQMRVHIDMKKGAGPTFHIFASEKRLLQTQE
jgi:hypothetical protein